MRRYAPLLLTLALVACGIDTTGITPESTKMPKGNPASLVTVTEYGDLECPACQSAHTIINLPLMQKYGDRIQFAFKQFPLSQHPYAHIAAEASECAADQGKFWEFVDMAYAKQKDLNANALKDWAKDLGLDMDLFGRCLDSGIKGDTVDADMKAGQALKVNSTPSYFVNGVRVPTNDLGLISAEIDKALGGAGNISL